MVCDSCQGKLGKVVVPDKWKEGARNTTENAGRKVGENKLLTKSAKQTFEPYSVKCKICKQKVHQLGSHYCQGCAYKLGICSMCGKKILDTTSYRQTSV